MKKGDSALKDDKKDNKKADNKGDKKAPQTSDALPEGAALINDKFKYLIDVYNEASQGCKLLS